mgnify:CR=1 FL=1
MFEVSSLLDSLDEESDRTPILIDKETDEEKLASAYDMRSRGKSTLVIARHFGVTQATIRSWILNYVQDYTTTFENQPKAHLIAEHLLFLSKLEDICLFEVDQVDLVDIAPDPVTGEVVRKRTAFNSAAKQRFVVAALQARKMKIDLMTTTGILPKEAEKIYHTLAGDRIDADKKGGFIETKTKEEMMQQILILVETGKVL